jgi:hypothetical protein
MVPRVAVDKRTARDRRMPLFLPVWLASSDDSFLSDSLKRTQAGEATCELKREYERKGAESREKKR